MPGQSIKVNTPGSRAIARPAVEGESLDSLLPGRNPDEVLGEIAHSNLMPGMIMATIACLALLAACTIVPYFLYPPQQHVEAATPAGSATTQSTTTPSTTAPATQSSDAVAASSSQAAASGESSSPKSAADTPPTGASPEALKKLDVDEVKSSPKNVNPLEESQDDLLNDLK